MSGPDAVAAAAIAFCAAVACVIAPFSRALSRRIGGGGSADAGEARALREDLERLRAELDALRARTRELDDVQNRLDFAERMLAQAREKGALGPPRSP